MTAVTFDFAGTSVLVPGGTRGIGLAVAGGFRAAGANVTITGTRPDPASYDADLSGFRYEQLDLMNPADVAALDDRLDAVDILVNNAGANFPGGRSEWEPDAFADGIALNLISPFRLTTTLRSRLAASGAGAVVNTASLSAFFGLEMVPAYGAARAAITQLTKTLAIAWARHDIRVNAAAPGIIETDMTAPMFARDQLTAPMRSRTPAGRFGTPADVTDVVMFLASPSARYITGQTLLVDGGYSIQG
ncbi:SDR family NAD(P)-dependent oxidoreductase [Nocardia suismassiliense]|uniref:SDR family NAD(P)-dependent oxidoreductase n=1 Tax=Nocardia suismassiliense TaxID=2077092 RepID=UPI000D1DE75D|nr:SDR family oxidoreductase [Nocardia suismassiliense]